MKAVVVGSGPAGMFCAYELSKAGIEVTLIEGGRDIERRQCPREKQMGYCVNCPQCQLIQGVGGSGLFSDGKLNLDPEIGGNMLEFMERGEADALIRYVDEIFLSHGAKDGESTPDEKAKDLVMKAKSAGVRFIPIHQRHMGSDRLPAVIRSIMDEMDGRGVKLVTETRVDDVVIEDSTAHGVRAAGNTLDADFVVIAPGRAGAHWLGDMCIKLGIHTRHQPIDIGVRVEVPAEIMDWVTSICWDPKFHIQTRTYDDFVRTFCTNPQGFVISESYGEFITVNGHSMRGTKSNNTNFAFLVRVNLTEPVENTTSYGESIAKMATTIGGGKPVIQRFGDLRAGRRSTWERINKSYVKPTFMDVTPGDISMTLPARMVTDIIEGLDALNKVIPGVAEDSTLIYSPEIKFHALRVMVSKTMETNIKNLFTVGDGAGVSRGIVGAAVTGLVAAREIIKRAKG